MDSKRGPWKNGELEELRKRNEARAECAKLAIGKRYLFHPENRVQRVDCIFDCGIDWDRHQRTATRPMDLGDERVV